MRNALAYARVSTKEQAEGSVPFLVVYYETLSFPY